MSLPGAAPARAFVALGGNLGDAAATLERALRELAALPATTLQARSRLYRTPAWGRTDQPDFINAVAELHTSLSAPALLAALLGVERRAGRDRSAENGRWGPRVLDLDLLLHGDSVVDAPGLVLPHPRLHERAFVLVPLAELAPALAIPGRGRVDDLLATVDAAGIEAIP